MTQNIRAIILSVTKVGERQLVLHTLSEEYGRRSFIAGVSKYGAMFMPLSIIDATIRENPKTDLWRLSDPTPAFHLNSLRSSMTKNAIGLFMSEVLYRTLKDGSYEDGLYKWTERSIVELDELQGSSSNYPLKFLFGLCTSLGFNPAPEELAPFVGDSYNAPLTGTQRKEMAESILKYLSVHTDSNINIRSLGVLHEVCADLS